MKIIFAYHKLANFRDRFDSYLASGHNATLFEKPLRYKEQLCNGFDSHRLDTVIFDKLQADVSDIICLAQDTQLSSNVSERFIAVISR